MSEQTTLAVLNDYPREKYNVLAPATVTQVTPWHQITVSQVTIDTDPRGMDVYPVAGKLALHKTALLRLADAAGIRFKLPQFERDPDDGSYDCYVTAEKQDPDGTWRQYPGSYRWDVTERVAQVKAPTSAEGIADIKMIRKFSMQRAETGALSRAVRNIIQLEAAYSAADLRKPFIVARVTFNPWSDPLVANVVRQALATKLAANVSLLRGDDGNGDEDLEAQPVRRGPTPQQVEAARKILALVSGDENPAGQEVVNGHVSHEVEPTKKTDPEPTNGSTDKGSTSPATEKKNLRPLAPERVRGLVRWKAQWVKGEEGDYSDAHRDVSGEPITDGQVIGVASLLGKAVARKGWTQIEMDRARHDVLDYILMVRSTKQLSKREARAMIEWLGAAGEDGSIAGLHPDAAAEVNAILALVQVENGQAALPLEQAEAAGEDEDRLPF